MFFKLQNRSFTDEKFQILIDDIPVEVIYKEIRNIHIVVYPPYGKVKISAPKGIPLEAIESFAVSKSVWIKKHRSKYHDVEPHLLELTDTHKYYYYLGKPYAIKTILHTGKSKISLNETDIELHVKKGISQRKKQNLLNEWSRLQLNNIIPQLIEKWEKRMNVSVTGFGIKRMKTRWGSCNIKTKRIWLNLELAKKPLQCIEYIVVHEMVHLLERKHNTRFKAYLDEFLPGWREYKKELNFSPSPKDKQD
jgi:predicted metal-dependent hydrolase